VIGIIYIIEGGEGDLRMKGVRIAPLLTGLSIIALIEGRDCSSSIIILKVRRVSKRRIRANLILI